MRIAAACVFVCLLAFPALAPSSLAEEGEERGPWSRLERMDENGDGKVTKDEFTGPDRIWDRLDRDSDGVITKDEAQNMRGRRGGRSGGMPGGGRGGSGGLSFEKLDLNKDGKISKPEWDAFLKKADENEDTIIQKEEWDAAVGGRAMRDSAPKVGDTAPKVSAKLRGSELMVDLSAPKRTTVLIFGSWTWGPFGRDAGRLQAVYEKYKGKADFYLVYIREAHPQDGRLPNKKIKIDQPKTFERREEVAGDCIKDLELRMPVCVDDMNDTVAKAYNAMPDRLFVLKSDGTIGYRGDRGPRGFDVNEMEKALKAILAKG